MLWRWVSWIQLNATVVFVYSSFDVCLPLVSFLISIPQTVFTIPILRYNKTWVTSVSRIRLLVLVIDYLFFEDFRLTTTQKKDMLLVYYLKHRFCFWILAIFVYYFRNAMHIKRCIRYSVDTFLELDSKNLAKTALCHQNSKRHRLEMVSHQKVGIPWYVPKAIHVE